MRRGSEFGGQIGECVPVAAERARHAGEGTSGEGAGRGRSPFIRDFNRMEY